MVLEIMSTLPDSTVKMSEYANNFTARRIINGLKHCCDTLYNSGPKFDYYPLSHG